MIYFNGFDNILFIALKQRELQQLNSKEECIATSKSVGAPTKVPENITEYSNIKREIKEEISSDENISSTNIDPVLPDKENVYNNEFNDDIKKESIQDKTSDLVKDELNDSEFIEINKEVCTEITEEIEELNNPIHNKHFRE